MATTTTKRGLRKPGRSDYINVVTDINNNMDNLDDAVPDSRKVNGKALSSDVTIDDTDLPIIAGKIASTQAMIAPPFVEATPNAAGSYVTNAGALYYLPDGHAANTTWANTSKKEVKAGSELTNLKSALVAVDSSTAEDIGIKLGTYIDHNVLFLQGGINPNTGVFDPTNLKRATTRFILIPSGATISASVETGYVKSNFVWFDAQKTYIGQGNPMPSGAKYVRFLVQKSDGTQLITPDEAQNVTTFTITQPYSVSGINSKVNTNTEKIDEIYPMYEVYSEYIVEKNNVSNKMTYGVFGTAYNDATYSNGVLTIPQGKTGASSYIGVRITGGFALLKNTIARVRIAFDDISSLDIETKILKSPNTNTVNVIDSKISMENNTVEYTFLVDSDTFTYLFFGVMIKTSATAQTNQKVITFQSATIYSSESYDNPNKRTLKMQLFGDSITDDVRVVSGSETIITTWASKIAEYMTGYNLTIVNSAVGGSGIGHGKSSTARYSTKEYNYVHDLVTDGTLVTDSDVITLLIGTNNWRGEGGGSFGTLGQLGDNTVSTFYGAANLICKYIAEHSNALLVIITPPQRYNSTDQESQTTALGEVLNSSGHTLKDYCKALKEVAALYGYPVVDLNDDLGWNKYNVANFTSDGLHPSALKCYRLTEVICGAIKAYLGD